jgi:hypothetical protein
LTSDINEITKLRFRILKALYDISNASVTTDVTSDALAKRVGIEETIVMNVMQYLQGKDLVEIVPFRPSGVSYDLIRIKTKGIDEVEIAKSGKETPIEHFSPNIVALIGITEAPSESQAREHVVQLDETVPVKDYVTEQRATTTISDVGIDYLKSLLPPVISTDKPTLGDTLGYQVYAYALARFLTDSRTTAPISISIQAPWGGGKTSLMRMVRSMLDKRAPELPGEKSKKKEQESQEVISLKDIKKKLKTSKKVKKTHPEPEKRVPARGDIDPRITIWFNAWKYESTQQVWAGLGTGSTINV